MSVFTKQDVIQDLGRIDPGTTSWWPQPTPTDLGRVDSPLSPCVTISERAYTMQFPQLGFKWMTNQLGKMPALLRQLLKLPPLPCPGVELTSPITPPDQAWKRRIAACTSCDCFDKVVKFGDYWCHPWGHMVTATHAWKKCFPELPVLQLSSLDQFQQEG